MLFFTFVLKFEYQQIKKLISINSLMNKWLVLLLFFIFSENVIGISPEINELINKIEKLQIYNDSFYNNGMFASLRITKNKKSVEDNNIFFTAITAYNLKTYKPFLDSINQHKINRILSNIQPNYSDFLNPNNKLTYNFWKKKKNAHFPNSTLLSKLDKFAIPDDFDDTSILYCINDSINDTTCKLLSLKMLNHVNGKNQTIKSTQKKYKKFNAYSTWFGKRMPIDFDICVHSNILLFKLLKNQTLNYNDSCTAKLIQEQICNSNPIDYTWQSPHYQKQSIVLYHVARTINFDKEHKLFSKSFNDTILNKLNIALGQSSTFMDSLLIKNSIMRLGNYCNKMNYNNENIENKFNNFYFFIANMGSTLSYPLNKWLANSSYLKQYYYSEAYYYSLLIEHEILYQNTNIEEITILE